MNPTILNACPQSLGFQINQGQHAPQVKFCARSPSYHLFLTSSETLMILKPSTPPLRNRAVSKLAPIRKLAPTGQVELTLQGSNPNPLITGLDKLPGKMNYLIGNAPDNWHTDIASYAKVKYQNVYPNIDALYSANPQHFKWDFLVHPGGNPEEISLDFTGTDGLILDEQGNLLLTIGDEVICLHKPVVYQEEEGQHQRIIPGNYYLQGNQVSFHISNYDQSKTLVIDPIIEYSTYIGGRNDDYCYASALDTTGNIYVTGLSWSSWAAPLGFPLKNPYQADNAGLFNAFITKLTPEGVLVYSTYLGGNDSDNAWGIAVDTAGCAYITGGTYSEDFPLTPNAIQQHTSNSWDVFVTKLNPLGNQLLYSTCLGGSQTDIGYAVALDADNNIYLTGYTESSSADPEPFPTKNAIQADNNSLPGQDAFITKINRDGSLGYSTYLGGWAADIGYGIATDASRNVYVTGSTSSGAVPLPLKGFPITPHCFQPEYGNKDDAFITKLDSNGALLYSSYLGGWNFDEGRSVVADDLGNAYITGFTASDTTHTPSFPTYKPLQGTFNGNVDAFITKVNATGDRLLYSTYLGGEGDDRGYGIGIDEHHYIYVTGYTTSTNSMGDWPPSFPLKNPLQQDNNGQTDAFISKLTPDGSELIFSSYLGGLHDDFGSSIHGEADGTTYVTGFTFSAWDPPIGPPGFPVIKAIQNNNNGANDVFVLKLAPVVALSVTPLGPANPSPLGHNLTYKFTITNSGPDPATQLLLTDTLPPNVDFIGASTGCTPRAGVVACELGVLGPNQQTTVTITIKPQNIGLIINQAAITCQQSPPLTITFSTKIVIPQIYTHHTIMTNWRKHPPV